MCLDSGNIRMFAKQKGSQSLQWESAEKKPEFLKLTEPIKCKFYWVQTNQENVFVLLHIIKMVVIYMVVRIRCFGW